MNSEYELLDSGSGRKLEKVGPYYLIRPAANAVWAQDTGQRAWEQADGIYTRKSNGRGVWRWNSGRVPESWPVTWKELRLLIKPTAFGHLGFFAEQYENWHWLKTTCAKFPGKTETLNLFAYSGGSSLAMASGGVKVTHVDAAKGMISWAKENQELNPEIPQNIRWIVDDVGKFMKREVRRKHLYQGIVLDPPTFGRGAQGQVWKMDDHIIPLLEQCKAMLLPGDPFFVLLSCHSPGYTPLVLQRLLAQCFSVSENAVEYGEMTISEASGRLLSAGAFARFSTL